MILAEIKQLDQKNRVHIPTNYLDICDIPINGNIVISVNTRTQKIEIQAIPKEAQNVLTKNDFNI